MANGLLVDQPLGELLAAFASRNPTPGGGSASALAASLGAALLLMVGAMPKTRLGTEEDRVALDTAVAALIPIQHRLTAAVDADAAAYAQVVAAYKQPKTTQPEREARLASVQRALRAATDVPLDVMRLSVVALEHAGAIAEHGHRAAASDVGVAARINRRNEATEVERRRQPIFNHLVDSLSSSFVLRFSVPPVHPFSP